MCVFIDDGFTVLCVWSETVLLDDLRPFIAYTHRSSCVWVRETTCVGNSCECVTVLERKKGVCRILSFSDMLHTNTDQFSLFPEACMKDVWVCVFKCDFVFSPLAQKQQQPVTAVFSAYVQCNWVFLLTVLLKVTGFFFHTSAEEQTLIQFNFWCAEWADYGPSFSHFLLKSVVRYKIIGCDSK